MYGEAPAAGSRGPLRHPLIPRWRISLQRLKSGRLAFDLACPDCDDRHLVVATIQPVGRCTGSHCGPGPHNHNRPGFTSTHNGPSYADDFYRPSAASDLPAGNDAARTAAGGPDPADLL